MKKIFELINRLREKGVHVPKDKIPNTNTSMNFLKSIESELKLTWILGNRIGFDAVKILANDSDKRGDADILLDLNRRYFIQVKSPQYLLSLQWNTLMSSCRNLYDGGKFSLAGKFDLQMQKVDRGFGAIIKARPGFSIDTMSRKFEKDFQVAQGQLKSYPDEKIFAFDIRGYYGSEYHLIKSITQRLNGRSLLAGVLILSKEPNTATDFSEWDRIIYFPNYENSSSLDRDDIVQLGYQSRLQTYETRPFIIPTKINEMKRGNNWLEFRGRDVFLDDTHVGHL